MALPRRARSPAPRSHRRPLPNVGSLAQAQARVRSSTRARFLDTVSSWTLGAGWMIALGGFTLASPVLLSFGTALLGAGFAAQDIVRVRFGLVSPMTVYAITLAVSALANAIGIDAADSSGRALYVIYADEEYLMLAAELTFAGLVVPVLAFRLTERRPELRALLDILPRIAGAARTSTVVRWAPLLSAAVIVLRLRGPLPALGTLSGVVELIPHLAAFTLARLAWAENLRRPQAMALAIAIAEAIRALLFDYLRISVVAPLAAYTLGALLGARSLRPLRTARFAPIYVGAAVIVAYFGTFGEARSLIGTGVSRIAQLQEMQEDSLRSVGAPKQTVFSRLTNFNQLSQIGRIVEEDGFLGGSTLEYLGFAFVPRFLWPEKPIIQKGAWFALRIGQAHIARDGRITNSVNMTIPGELYLNYAWMGVLVGCFIFGTLLAAFWTRTDFWMRPDNILGSAFGFYLLWIGLILGADLQILVTLIATYLVFLAASIFLPPPHRQRVSSSIRPAPAVGS